MKWIKTADFKLNLSNNYVRHLVSKSGKDSVVNFYPAVYPINTTPYPGSHPDNPSRMSEDWPSTCCHGLQAAPTAHLYLRKTGGLNDRQMPLTCLGALSPALDNRTSCRKMTFNIGIL